MKMFEYTPEERLRLMTDPRFKVLGSWEYYPDEQDEETYMNITVTVFRGVYLAEVEQWVKGHCVKSGTYPLHNAEDPHLFYYLKKGVKIEFMFSEFDMELMGFPNGIYRLIPNSKEDISDLTS